MTLLHRLPLFAAVALLAGCVVAPYPYPASTPPPTVTKTPPSFDRSWDAALVPPPTPACRSPALTATVAASPAARPARR